MDLEVKKVLDIQLVQSNEVKGSTHMEMEGLKRGLNHINNDHGLTIKTLVTDRHRMVQKYMREERADIKHYFDVWYLAKGISKKLEAAAKKKDGELIRPWIKSTVNHAYWVATSCADNGKLKVAKWKSLMNHITDKHEDHSTIFCKCEHGPILEERQWLRDGSRAYKLMDKVVRSPHILRDIQKLSPVHQTYGLEVFHNVVNHYAPKSTHFFYGSMLARLHLAALHYNENSNNAQAVTKTGHERWRVVYPKSKKGMEAVVKPCKVDPTFGYIILLKQSLMDFRQDLPTFTEACIVKKEASQYPPPLTASYKQFSKDELLMKHKSRFMKS
ncbi:hypothetical protein ACJMK2_013659 [Sinanodonta woodiana]|uniref:Uncharacterized protein n=1 Tax=Sinanodonta woodiana TaxID=1069815 RepID=A0ABD3V183_SINWO